MSNQRRQDDGASTRAFDNVLMQYGSSGGWTYFEGQSGWNNTTRYVLHDGRKWVLRLYETHREADKVAFEHAILLALNDRMLPFKVPCPVTALNGKTYVYAEDGTGRLACLFPYLVGERPRERDSEVAAAIGTAAGELSQALSRIEAAGKPEYPPYYEMDLAHPLCAPDKVAAFCAAPPEPFTAEAGRLVLIGQSLEEIRRFLPRLRELPHQLIHGDINHSNLLGDREITAVLDFEFCTWDLRVMELAVIVAGLLSESEEDSDGIDLPLIEATLRGFGKHVQLSLAEVEAIPILVRLRKLDVFLHFLGRYWDGVDDSGVLLSQLRSTERGLIRFRKIERQIEKLSRQYLTILNK